MHITVSSTKSRAADASASGICFVKRQKHRPCGPRHQKMTAMNSPKEKSLIDVNKMRSGMSPIRNWDAPFSIYYDETNNIRRLTLSEIGLNAPDNRTFVLAGVALRPGEGIETLDDLRASMRIQPGTPELKFRHLVQGEYEAALDSRKLNTFLAWCLDRGVLIHYSALNVLYWSLIDIIESLMGDHAFGINLYRYHLHLKSELYDIVTRNPADFMRLLHSFAYPDIDRGKIRPFLTAVSDFLDAHSPKNRNGITAYLKTILRQASRLSTLDFLHDNEAGELISDLSMQFLNRVYVFKSATHVFDRETYIEKALSTVEMHDGARRIDYRFVDSKDSICVQLSDVIAGLFGKHFNYLQDNTLARLLERKAAFSNRQSETLAMITKLIDRSDDVSNGFFHRVAPMDISFKNDAFLHEMEVPPFIE